MNKFRKHITKKRKLLNKRKRIHRRTIKKTKGGMDLYKAFVGLLILANGTQAFQNRPHVGQGIKTKPVLPPPPRGPTVLHLRTDDSSGHPKQLTEQQLEKIAEENIGNKIKQDAVETYVTAKTKELLGEGANTLFARPVEEIVNDIKDGKNNQETEELIKAVRQQIG